MTGQIMKITSATDIGAAIKKRRLELRMSQDSLAESVGVSQPTVSAVEAGKDTAQVGVVIALCVGLGIQLQVR